MPQRYSALLTDFKHRPDAVKLAALSYTPTPEKEKGRGRREREGGIKGKRKKNGMRWRKVTRGGRERQ